MGSGDGQLSDSFYSKLGLPNTFSADQYFKSGRPWFDIIAFGADPTGVADSTVAIQTTINTALGLRTDTGVSMSGFTVTDPAAVSGDVGKYVNSPNYATIVSYPVGVTASNATMQITGVAAAPFVANQPVVLTAASAPGGFTSGTTYFILSPSLVSTTFSFSLSATSGGGAITPTTTGTTVAVKAPTGGCSLITAVTSGPVGYTVATPAAASLSGQVVGIGSGSSVSSRIAAGPVFIPSGTYKVTTDLLVQSVSGFALLGSGNDSTTLRASGAGFTEAALLIDGSADGLYAGFQVNGDTTEGTAITGSGGGIPDAIRLDWTTAASRSTTGNTFRHVRVRGLKFVVGISLEGNGTRQVDGTSLQDVVISGQQVAGSWSSSGNWQKGFAFGNGTQANNYDHVLYNSSAASCFWGMYCNASGFELYGSQPAANSADFFVTPGAQVSINGVQSQSASQFIVGSGGSATVAMSVRDVLWLTNNLISTSAWVQVAGGAASWLFENIRCITGTTGGIGGTGVPLMSFSGSGNKENITLINLMQAAPPSTGITVTNGGSVVCVNYVQTNSVGQVSALFPLWCLNAGALYQQGTAASRPTATATGEGWYYATDTGALSRSNGSAWTAVTPLAGGLGSVAVSGTAAAGNVLAATSSSAAAWTAPAVIDGVTVSGTPSGGQVLTATSATAANWQAAASGSQAAADAGYVAWTGDPAIGNSTHTAGNIGIYQVTGSICLTRLDIPSALTANGFLSFYWNQPTGGTPANCFVGLYDGSGNRIFTSSDLTSTASQVLRLNTGQTSYTAGPVYIASLTGTQGTTAGGLAFFEGGELLGGPGVTAVNGRSAAPFRCSSLTGSATSLPSSLTLSSFVANYYLMWGALD